MAILFNFINFNKFIYNLNETQSFLKNKFPENFQLKALILDFIETLVKE